MENGQIRESGRANVPSLADSARKCGREFASDLECARIRGLKLTRAMQANVPGAFGAVGTSSVDVPNPAVREPRNETECVFMK